MKLQTLDTDSKWSKVMRSIESIKYIEDNQHEFFDDYYAISFDIDLLNGVDLTINAERIFLQTSFGRGQLKEALVKGVNAFITWFEGHKK